MAAIDCEMCDTKAGLEVTRMTIVDSTYTVILDTFIKPKLEIVDYRTQWSGITYEKLKNVNITLEQARLAFMRLISKETILVGKSY
jgi:RNA exonuclease 1